MEPYLMRAFFKNIVASPVRELKHGGIVLRCNPEAPRPARVTISTKPGRCFFHTIVFVPQGRTVAISLRDLHGCSDHALMTLMARCSLIKQCTIEFLKAEDYAKFKEENLKCEKSLRDLPRTTLQTRS